MRKRMLGARGRVVQKGMGEAHMFLLTHASWAEPNGSVYCCDTVSKSSLKSITPEVIGSITFHTIEIIFISC